MQIKGESPYELRFRGGTRRTEHAVGSGWHVAHMNCQGGEEPGGRGGPQKSSRSRLTTGWGNKGSEQVQAP